MLNLVLKTVCLFHKYQFYEKTWEYFENIQIRQHVFLDLWFVFLE